jgi:hypothetical protein
VPCLHGRSKHSFRITSMVCYDPLVVHQLHSDRTVPVSQVIRSVSAILMKSCTLQILNPSSKTLATIPRTLPPSWKKRWIKRQTL